MANPRRAPALWSRISRSSGWGSPVRGSLSAAVVSVAVSPVTMAQDGSSVNGGGRGHHRGGLFLLALAEALWLGFGTGRGGDTYVRVPSVMSNISPQAVGTPMCPGPRSSSPPTGSSLWLDSTCLC